MARTPAAKLRRRRAARPAVEEGGVTQAAFCPICGMLRPLSYGGARGERKEAWALTAADRQFFGALLRAGGRGRGGVVGYISPEGAPELHRRVKEQLLAGLEVWMQRGWVEREDLERLL